MTSELARWLIAKSPRQAPAGYDGKDLLAALNLGLSTALCFISICICADIIRRLWINRHRDGLTHPVTLYRLTILSFSAAIMLRKGVAAAALWQWDPAHPDTTAAFVLAQHIINPIADMLQYLAFGLTLVAGSTTVNQLRRQPWDIPVWESIGNLKRPTLFVVFAVIAAILVVYTR